MEDRHGSVIGYLIIASGVFLMVILGIIFVNARRIISPVPDDDAIKIIYITPVPTSAVSPTGIIPSNPI
jgi:hypothetical protein